MENRIFKCPNCGYEEEFLYFVRQDSDPDGFECYDCKEIFWWAHHLKKLFRGKDHASFDENDAMKLIAIDGVSVQK